MELLAGHPVMISRAKRVVITKKHRSNPLCMVTALLEEIIGPSKLANMKARSRRSSDLEPVPKEIMNAVEGKYPMEGI